MYTLILYNIDKLTALDYTFGSFESKQVGRDTYLFYEVKPILQDDLDYLYSNAEFDFKYDVIKDNRFYLKWMNLL